MNKRFVAIWFPRLITDWMLRKDPGLKDVPFVLAMNERGRRVVKAANGPAKQKGISVEMVVADCRALEPSLKVFDYEPLRKQKLLYALAEWFMRYTPFVSVDLPDGLLLDASGCTHLWGGEEAYMSDIQNRLKSFGYNARTALADTVGSAWGVSRFGKADCIVKPGAQAEILSALPPAALRLDVQVTERLEKLGLKTIAGFMHMPRQALRRRFGAALLKRLDQALGYEIEFREPIRPVPSYLERLPSMEPIITATGIEIGLRTLLETLCLRLSRENKGVRKCEFRCYRVDGATRMIDIGTSRPSRNAEHLFRLFVNKITQIEPGLGIELFALEAPVVEDLPGEQDALWSATSASDVAVAELLDRLEGRTGGRSVQRYLPAEHYWPERSFISTKSLTERSETTWRSGMPRPLHLLQQPEPIEVSAPVPDYPPLLFRYRGALHTVKKADGPERIEQEWWIGAGLYRDYYCVEDESGARYWLFRSGDYNRSNPEWFLHGFFA